ncbi:MAG: hypothetical protein R3F20_14825 [Planctomycetota bacterium]
MSPDVELALALLEDQRRARRNFGRRFQEILDRAHQHCREAAQLGLDRDRYEVSIGDAAAHALLASLPLDATEARLDPFVRRVSSRRDFALAILLIDDLDEAWRLAESRFSDFVDSLLIRRGIVGHELEPARREFFDGLRRPDASGRRAIESYLGRSDFRDWLFVHARCHFRGGAALPAEPLAASPACEADAEITAAWPEAFAGAFQALPEEDRARLEGISVGAPIEPARASRAFSRHRELVDQLFQAVVERVASRTGRDRTAVEDGLDHCLVGEVEERLELVCGPRPEDLRLGRPFGEDSEGDDA